jgi:hypothetical protein
VKCAPCRRDIGTPLYDVGRYDLPALAGFDFEETLNYWHPDERVHEADWVSYTDPNWREVRQRMTTWWGLAILLVHGPSLQEGLDDLVQLKIENGIRNLELAGAPMPETARRLSSIQKIERRDIQADAAVGALFGWALPLARSG